MFNEGSKEKLDDWLAQKNFPQTTKNFISALFQPISPEETVTRVKSVLSSDEKTEEILRALFGSYVFACFEEEAVHRKINKDCAASYYPDFWSHLQTFYSRVLNRNCGLVVLYVDQVFISTCPNFEDAKERILTIVKRAYEELSNHCYLAVIIDPFDSVTPCDERWNLISDIVLFAEKFIEGEIDTGYFRKDKVRQQTANYIEELDIKDARFDLGNEGFAYKDCLIFTPASQVDDNSYSCVLLFEKNYRDETPIPCPACRSTNIRGNSYPILGVRSWECQNQFCPDRSKYNRGKRFSVSSLIRQQAILDPRNHISREYLKLWRRDITEVNKLSEIMEMLIRLYSLFGDTVVFYSLEALEINAFGRTTDYRKITYIQSECHIRKNFYQSHFFKRYKIEKKPLNFERDLPENMSKYVGLEVYCGNTYEILCCIPSDTFHGAVTSPPYYNAKSYSQWPNIYCYLYDMLNIGREIYRVLKDGSPFMFNIFDYFDNENNIVFSDMGKKRMILGYYVVNMFSEIGFQVSANIPWDKGHIEGNRNFNQGNFSPYYQAPHNCWEHIFVFSKGHPQFDLDRLPKILKATPVIKMYNGHNQLGHSAPYPDDIPQLLLDLLTPGAKILDPFSGSMTTGRVAYLNGYKSVNIDYKKEYCELGLKLLEKELLSRKQLPLTL